MNLAIKDVPAEFLEYSNSVTLVKVISNEHNTIGASVQKIDTVIVCSHLCDKLSRAEKHLNFYLEFYFALFLVNLGVNAFTFIELRSNTLLNVTALQAIKQ